MASNQEEEVLGKAYDSRLMGRLLRYLKPYTWQVVTALVAIILKAAADVCGPYLTKVAVDRYLAPSGTSASPCGRGARSVARRSSTAERATARPSASSAAGARRTG